jgi:hypothetical protein
MQGDRYELKKKIIEGEATRQRKVSEKKEKKYHQHDEYQAQLQHDGKAERKKSAL